MAVTSIGPRSTISALAAVAGSRLDDTGVLPLDAGGITAKIALAELRKHLGAPVVSLAAPQYGAALDGVTNDREAFLAACADACATDGPKVLVIGAARANLGGPITMDTGTAHGIDFTNLKIRGVGFGVTRFTKGANGVVFAVSANGIEMVDVDIDGAGATGVTGGGIALTGVAQQFRWYGGDITNTNGHPVEYAGGAGIYSSIEGARIFCYAAAPSLGSPPAYEGVRYHDDGADPMYRKLLHCTVAPFHRLARIGGQVTKIFDCDTHNFTFDATANKCSMVANRIATIQTRMVVKGHSHMITANEVAGPIEIFDLTTYDCVIGPNLVADDGTGTNGYVDNGGFGGNIIIGAANGADCNMGTEKVVRVTWNPGVIANGAQAGGGAGFFVLCNGAQIGDAVTVSAEDQDQQGVRLWGYVHSLSDVRIYATNHTGGSVTLATGVFKVRVRRL